jgi:hypothetical protein
VANKIAAEVSNKKMKNRKILKIIVRFCFAKKYIVQRIKFTQKVAKSGTKWI